MSILNATELKLLYGEIEIFSGVALDVSASARIGLVGPNGGGKSSLIRVLVGEQGPSSGHVYRSTSSRIGYVPQISQATTLGTIRDEILEAFRDTMNLETKLAKSALAMERSDGLEFNAAEKQYSSLLDRYERMGGHDYHNQVDRAADGVGLSKKVLEHPVNSASGGEITRAALARALLSDPDLLVLDEPTNYLDFNGLAWLESFLKRSSHAFVVVSHDRYFLDQVADQIWDLDHGYLETYKGNYSKYRVLKDDRINLRLKEYERQQGFIAREQSFIDRYRAGQRSRQAKGREKRLDRLERIVKPTTRSKSIRIRETESKRAPRIVMSTRGLKLGFVERNMPVELAKISDLFLERGSRTAVIGSNGAGKTTMLQTFLGKSEPLAGTVQIGTNVTIGYLRQGTHDLPQDLTALEVMQKSRNISIQEERDYLANFLFIEDDIFKRVSSMSGGERARLSIASLMSESPNFLVLDEPTTHLDIPSREALENALKAYDGTLLFVSHDRHLISMLANQLIVLEESCSRLFKGTFNEWIMDRTSSKPKENAGLDGPNRGPVKIVRKRRKKESLRQKEPNPDFENKIIELESSLERLEVKLQSASAREDVLEVVRLGEEYEKVRIELDKVWDSWRA